jgi:hypothetical protein
MGHPDEGMIRALMDGEAAGQWKELRAHLDECPQCAAMAGAQARAHDALVAALPLLDVEPPIEKARARILRREAERRRPVVVLRRNLPRAASFVVLLTAGTAFALPGSPLREWLATTWKTMSEPGEGATETSPAMEGVPPIPGTVGATIPATLDGLQLSILGLREGASVRVLLVEGNRAGIFADEGTRFRSEARGLEATQPPGDVTMEVPRDAPLVTIVVNGEVFLRKTAQGLEILGPVRNRTSTEIRFGPTGGDTNRPPSDG